MKTLSERPYWDSVHRGGDEAGAARRTPPATDAPRSRRRRALRALKRRLRPRTLDAMSSYASYRLWSVLLPRYLAGMHGATVLEVGSAPGLNLVRFSRLFGCIPYGVDYSEAGVEVNRRVFTEHGLDPAHVIHADFFSEAFQERYRGSFDIVYSGGFIEHFTDARAVVARHVDLLADGGHLIVSIPNLRGLNYALTAMFCPSVLPIHNLGIMTKPAFRALFDDDRLTASTCDYAGTFSLDLFADDASPRTRPQRVLRQIQTLQPLLNLGFRRLFGERGAENRWMSPYLVFIGRKRHADGRRDPAAPDRDGRGRHPSVSSRRSRCG